MHRLCSIALDDVGDIMMLDTFSDVGDLMITVHMLMIEDKS